MATQKRRCVPSNLLICLVGCCCSDPEHISLPLGAGKMVWQRRFVVIRGSRLFYYKDKTRSEVLGTISLIGGNVRENKEESAVTISKRKSTRSILRPHVPFTNIDLIYLTRAPICSYHAAGHGQRKDQKSRIMWRNSRSEWAVAGNVADAVQEFERTRVVLRLFMVQSSEEVEKAMGCARQRQQGGCGDEGFRLRPGFCMHGPVFTSNDHPFACISTCSCLRSQTTRKRRSAMPYSMGALRRTRARKGG